MRTVFSNIAWKGLKGRRRATGMMLCVLAAAFALMTAMLCYDSSGAVAMEETRKSIYGEWQIARYALSESEAAEFIQETDPAAVGRAEQYAFLVNEQGLAFRCAGHSGCRVFFLWPAGTAERPPAAERIRNRHDHLGAGRYWGLL